MMYVILALDLADQEVHTQPFFGGSSTVSSTVARIDFLPGRHVLSLLYGTCGT